MKAWFAIFCLMMPAALPAAGPGAWSEQEVLQDTLAALRQGGVSNQLVRLSAGMSRLLNDTLRLRPDELARMSVAADCIRYLRLTDSVPLNSETGQWLFADPGRLHLLTGSVRPSDNLKQCFQCLETLLKHDPAGRERYFNLMLALSVVWDQPNRPPIHYQTGKNTLPYRPAVAERYDYFKELYASGDAKIPYGSLTVRDLVFVVDTPVPLSELLWARSNVRGNLEEWREKFDDIIYDSSRARAGQYQWPHGVYTLASIRRKGGICVDQGYYAVLTARAFGIPAAAFHAAGKSGLHQWFSYMRQPGQWELDVGRYESEAYTTGWTIDPQTNGQMTDHDLVYENSRALGEKRAAQSDAYAAIAETLIRDPDNVLRCIQQALKVDPQNLRAWQIKIDVLIANQDFRGLLDLFKDLRDAFDEHPDIFVDAAEKIGAVLAGAGLQEDADLLRRQMARHVDDDRDDLARFLGMDEIEALVKDGEIKKARRKMEDLLEEHLEDGRKAFPLIAAYLEMTKNTDQAEAAARFLEEYIGEMSDSFYFDIARREAMLDFLLQAYTHAGDEDGVAEINSRLADM
jgi:tetratricopeptide (TPR) repeat protein